jgi:hypothetical protein
LSLTKIGLGIYLTKKGLEKKILTRLFSNKSTKLSGVEIVGLSDTSNVNKTINQVAQFIFSDKTAQLRILCEITQISAQ